MADANYANERWLTIPFAADYEVSDHGRVKRTAPEPKQWCGHLLKPKVRADGYLEVVLYVDDCKMHIRVHQIVCRTFHGDRPHGKDEVGHVDGVRANCHANNLRWVTKYEQYEDRLKHGTHSKGELNPGAKLDPLKVQAVHILSERMPSRKVASVLGISKSQVGNIMRGDAWSGSDKRRTKRVESKRQEAA